MAERSSTRTWSRRNTPQPVVEPTRTTRATRSRSHNISDNEGARYVERVREKHKRATSNSEEPDTEQREGAPDKPELSTVNEDTEPRVEDGDQAVEANQDQLPDMEVKSSARISGISGTTARTSNSAQELAQLASQDLNVLDALPDLLESSKKLLNVLVPTEISSNVMTELRHELQVNRSALKRNRDRFMVDFDSCHPDPSSTTFLEISRALPLLHGNEDGRRLLDPVIHAANLAILASNILLYPQQEDEKFLENLDACFPEAFTNDQTGTLQLEIETRTQYAIMRLSEHTGQPNFDPDIILNQVFYTKDPRTLRGFDLGRSRSKGSKDVHRSILQRVKDIRLAWSEKSKSSPIERLGQFYQWPQYAAQMMTWISGRTEDIKIALNPAEVQEIVQALKTILEATRSAKESSDDDGETNIESKQVDLSGFIPPTSVTNAIGHQAERHRQPSAKERELAGSKYLNLGSPRLAQGAVSMKRAIAKHMKALNTAQQTSRDQIQPSRDAVQVTSTTGPAAQSSTPQQNKMQQTPTSAAAEILKDHVPNIVGSDGDNNRRSSESGGEVDNDDDQEEDEDAFQTQEVENAERTLQLRARLEAEGNKENEAESSQPRVRKSLIDRQTGAERLPWNSQDDESFQQPSRSVSPDRHVLQPTKKRSVTESLSATGLSPTKRARFQEPPLSENDAIQASQEAPRSSQVYNLANSVAKQMTALRPKAPQTRKPWTEEETETLLDLINNFGTSWKLLKVEDRRKMLVNRDQVALKDKARNMKFDFLKAGRRLPKNFDSISLSRLLIEKLSGMGVVYDAETGERVDADE